MARAVISSGALGTDIVAALKAMQDRIKASGGLTKDTVFTAKAPPPTNAAGIPILPFVASSSGASTAAPSIFGRIPWWGWLIGGVGVLTLAGTAVYARRR